MTIPMNILRLPEVKKRVGLCSSQIYALIKTRKFPRQIELGTNSVGWLESDVNDWIMAQVNKSRAKHSKDAGKAGGNHD